MVSQRLQCDIALLSGLVVQSQTSQGLNETLDLDLGRDVASRQFLKAPLGVKL